MRRWTMRLRTVLLAGCAISASLLCAAPGWGDPPPDAKDSHAIMRKKLKLSQDLLRAVATEDYAATREQAQQLAQLTHDAGWLVHRTETYRRESTEFEHSAYLLAEAAKQERLSATTLAFLGVTLSCVNCHQYLRASDEIEQREITIPPVAERADAKDTPAFWMAKKLELSEAILAGLAVGDAASIEKNASTMQALSKVEGWARRKDPQEYRALLDIFRQANAELIARAEKKDLDGAALAFTQVTLSCVKCHHHLRAANQDGPQEPATLQKP